MFFNQKRSKCNRTFLRIFSIKTFKLLAIGALKYQPKVPMLFKDKFASLGTLSMVRISVTLQLKIREKIA